MPDNYDVLSDRIKSLLARWDKFHDAHPGQAKISMLALLAEINDPSTQQLIDTEDVVLKCCLCGDEIPSIKESHNAKPLANGRCCEYCNDTKVLPARINQNYSW